MTPHQGTLRIQLQLRQPPQNRIEGDLAFEASQSRAETKMGSPPECQMAIVLACDIQAIGFGKSFWIAIASSHDCDYSLTLSDTLSSEFDIGGTQSGRVLTGTLVTKQLFHRRRNQRRVPTQPG